MERSKAQREEAEADSPEELAKIQDIAIADAKTIAEEKLPQSSSLESDDTIFGGVPVYHKTGGEYTEFADICTPLDDGCYYTWYAIYDCVDGNFIQSFGLSGMPNADTETKDFVHEWGRGCPGVAASDSSGTCDIYSGAHILPTQIGGSSVCPLEQWYPAPSRPS